MATSTILSLIVGGMSLLLHLLPSKKASTPASPSPTPAATPDNSSSSSSDKFSGFPGLPGHPLLNHLFGSASAKSANGTLIDLIKSDPTSLAQIAAALSSVAQK